MSTAAPLSAAERIAAGQSRLDALASLLAAGTGLPCQVPPRRGGGLVVEIGNWGVDRGEIDVIGFHYAERQVASPARVAALDRVERVMRTLGYDVTRGPLGGVRYTRPAPVCKAGDLDDAVAACAEEGGHVYERVEEGEDRPTVEMELAAIERMLAEGAVGGEDEDEDLGAHLGAMALELAAGAWPMGVGA